MDTENKDALFRLLRFNSNFSGSSNVFTSLDDYISRMKPGQDKIYYAFGPSYDAAMNSPFYEPFIGKDVPVLIITQQLDEFCLTSSAEFKGMKFVNIEQTQMDEIRKDLGIEANKEKDKGSRVPEEDVTNLCLWLKDVCAAKVAKVSLSKRLTNTPAILQGQMSSSMYMMMQMLQSSGQIPGGGAAQEMPKDLTLEINDSHPTIINLNTLRKADPAFAKDLCLVFLDQVLTTSNIPYDLKESFGRNQKVMEAYLDENLNFYSAKSKQH